MSEASKPSDPVVAYAGQGAYQNQIDELYECCDVFYRRYGDDAKTVSCPKASLLRFVEPHIAFPIFQILIWNDP